MDKLESDIVDRLKNGDTKAFRFIFDEYFYKLTTYAREFVKDNDTAEEIVEEMFVKLWEIRVYLNASVSFKAYLFRWVHNLCLDHIKLSQIHTKHLKNLAQKHSFDNIDLIANHNFYNDSLIVNELQQKIDNAIENLPEQCRQIFCLSRFENFKYAEIAQKLNLSVNTVEKQMSRALVKLRETLTEYLPVVILMQLIKNCWTGDYLI